MLPGLLVAGALDAGAQLRAHGDDAVGHVLDVAQPAMSSIVFRVLRIANSDNQQGFEFKGGYYQCNR